MNPTEFADNIIKLMRDYGYTVTPPEEASSAAKILKKWIGWVATGQHDFTPDHIHEAQQAIIAAGLGPLHYDPDDVAFTKPPQPETYSAEEGSGGYRVGEVEEWKYELGDKVMISGTIDHRALLFGKFETAVARYTVYVAPGLVVEDVPPSALHATPGGGE